MNNTLFYLLASAYSGISTLYGSAMTTCTVNGKIVECPKWFSTFSSVSTIFYWAILILMIVSMWMIFKKAGKPGWTAIIPIYGTIVLLQIVKKPTWWIILFLIPFVNVIIFIIVAYNLALAFGKGAGFTFGLIVLPFIFYPILAFGKSTYIYNTAETITSAGPTQATP